MASIMLAMIGAVVGFVVGGLLGLGWECIATIFYLSHLHIEQIRALASLVAIIGFFSGGILGLIAELV